MNEKIYAIDACFKLTLKSGKTKTSTNEPHLAPSGGVFVHPEEYETSLKANAKALEVGHGLPHNSLCETYMAPCRKTHPPAGQISMPSTMPRAGLLTPQSREDE
jgi:hypothetical protein